MKKSFLLLPVSIAILTACSSNSPAPIENVDGTLSPGVMQPVDNNSSGTWQPEIQQNTMPSTMGSSVPTGTQTPQPSFQPTYQPQPVQKPQAAPAVQNKPQQTSQDFTIPRNPETNAPDYSQINKGFYKGETYTVRKGDTMFLIAYISGLDVKELAALNNLSEPYQLNVGQVMKISSNRPQNVAPSAAVNTPAAAPQVTTPTAPESKPAEPVVTYTPGANGTQYGSDGTITGPVKATVGTVPPKNVPLITQNTPAQPSPSSQPSVDTAPANSGVVWNWPTNGSIIQGFSNADGGNKGIDISGSKGQAVNAAASGQVVYAGNALRGYGNLIIIKHSDDFLSAYAHNDRILVKDQQMVSAGQQIAKMGNTGTDGVKLHFEIRYKGKSVDPTRYLPRR